ncbi:MAG TPA: fibronectin type III domain-containing protein [Terriglobales bacterium]|jgi:hypothetical protein
MLKRTLSLVLLVFFVIGACGLYLGRRRLYWRYGVYVRWQHYFGKNLPSPHAVTLRWNSVAGAAIYHVYRSRESGGPFTKVSSTPLIFFVDVPVQPGADLYYYVTAENEKGESDPTQTMKVTVPIRWNSSD